MAKTWKTTVQPHGIQARENDYTAAADSHPFKAQPTVSFTQGKQHLCRRVLSMRVETESKGKRGL